MTTEKLKFIALSGTISVTENLYVYEYGDDMVVLDCGVGFPDLEMHGVDLVIPDFSYIVQNKHKLKGIVISQGHEDHLGALPFLFKEVRAEVWASPLVARFIEDKFDENKGVMKPKINVFNPESDDFRVGAFRFYPFRVTHSVPDTCGFAIDTPQGRVFHVPEHKMDQNPVDGMPFDIPRAKSLANGNILFLASDCLGSNKPGMVGGERHIEDNIFKIVDKAKSTVFFTAISSNIGRFQQAINVAERVGRKVVFVGRSVQKKCEISKDLGILKYKSDTVISIKEADDYYPNKLFYIIAGCYGQPGSSLYRLSLGEHERVGVEEGDTLIFSADPAPDYSKESENFVIDNFIDKGVDVHYYDLDEGLYVSGHGGQGDITELFKIVNPRYFIPIGGAIRFMHAYEKLVEGFGATKDRVFKLKPGNSVVFEDGKATKGESIRVKSVLVHGLGVGDVGRVVLGDRAVLGNEGVVVCILKINKSQRLVEKPKIVSRGFVFEKISKDLLLKGAQGLKGLVDAKKQIDENSIREEAENYLEKFFFKQTGRKPMILPVVVGV